MTTTQISPPESATATLPWAGEPVPTTRAGWVERARQAAGLVAATAFERDTTAAVPLAEVQWIKDAGLVGLQGPKASGGGDADWATVLDVVAEFAKVDGPIANVWPSTGTRDQLRFFFGQISTIPIEKVVYTVTKDKDASWPSH